MLAFRAVVGAMGRGLANFLRFTGGNLKESCTLDGRSLALFRIGLALLILADIGTRLPDLRVHYSDEGLLPISALPEEGRISIHVLNGSVWYQGGLFALQAVFALALLVGFRTHLATVVSWFLVLSLQGRNPLVLNGGDSLFRLLLFWAMFLPLGACWSLDRSLGRRGAAGPFRVFSMGSVALVLQICVMYWASVAFKSHDCWRKDGTAIYYALNIDLLVTPLGQYLLQFPRLLKVLTYSTYWFELIGPLLLFFPFSRGPVRTLLVLSFACFHVCGLGLTMELILFSYVCAVGWLAFLPGWLWDQLARLPVPGWAGSLGGMWAGVLTREAWLRLWCRCRPLAGRQVQATLGLSCLVLFLLIYMVAWNVRSIRFEKYSKVFSAQMSRLGNAVGIGQKWNLFAPRPNTNDGWFVVKGRLADGTEIDLLKKGIPIRWEEKDPLQSFAPIDWGKPELVSARFTSHRWRKYLEALGQDYNAKYRRHYAEYICRTWNTFYRDQQPLQQIEVFRMVERTLPNFKVAALKKNLVFAYDCPG